MTENKAKAEPPVVPDSPAATATASMAAGSAAMQAWMNMGNEMVRFLWDRLQQDIKTQQAMLACKNLDEIRQVQAEFFRKAQDQYTTEARKMMEMFGKATSAGLPASVEARKYDDVPL